MANENEKIMKFMLEGGCPTEVREEAIVTVPCTVRAYSEVGDVDLQCLGCPTISRNSSFTPGCPGSECRFTIRQKMCVKIPILFGADTDVGEGHVIYELDDNIVEFSGERERECGCHCGCSCDRDN